MAKKKKSGKGHHHRGHQEDNEDSNTVGILTVLAEWLRRMWAAIVQILGLQQRPAPTTPSPTPSTRQQATDAAEEKNDDKLENEESRGVIPFKFKKLKEHMGGVYLVRHGEREDHTNQGWKGRYKADPPLSKRGLRQAEDTGSFLTDSEPRPVVIFCSPFLRTLQTAGEIARSMKVPICVEPGLSEFLSARTFKAEPKLNPSSMEGLPIDSSYTPLLSNLPSFPEKEHQAAQRFLSTVTALADLNPTASIICVTHRFGAASLIDSCLSRIRSATVRPVGYCSVTCLVRKGPTRNKAEKGWGYQGEIAGVSHLVESSSMYFKR
eukprot:TRINITY_DN4569_c1_g1_i2.p1 TRINITY_DN4569_c1_g1~~TRINITY_DN4569_c1_g1_i2.p1  ORF type:complete len:322 (+),score=65.30 TRINITY_DN4569_c1_g1_i2:51-1016(+)